MSRPIVITHPITFRIPGQSEPGELDPGTYDADDLPPGVAIPLWAQRDLTKDEELDLLARAVLES